MPINDNDLPLARDDAPVADAHGRAALLLVESLIHGLCDHASLSNAAAVEVVMRAVDVQRTEAEETADATHLWHSHRLLATIAASLASDGKMDPQPSLI